MTLEEHLQQLKNRNSMRESQQTYQSSSECPYCCGDEWIREQDENGYWNAVPCVCRKKKELERRKEFASIPKKYEKITAKDFTTSLYKTADAQEKAKKAFGAINSYMKMIDEQIAEGKGLYIYSSTKGSGKTMMLSYIANKLIEKYPLKFAISNELLTEIRNTYNKNVNMSESELINRLCTIDILMVDDFGAEKTTDWTSDKWFEIINYRYNNGKITFFTSNFSVEELTIDGRVQSRVKEMTYQVHFPEESVRIMIAEKQNRKLFK